ncbi:MAG: fimbrillin family protein [Phocaeicola sp.]|nr:fimbrillin family protein [Phocaeicola sp.]
MKRGKYLLVVLLAGLVACTNDNLVPDGNGGLPTGGKELENIIFNVPDLEFDGPQTRGYYKVSDTSLGYQWTFGDTIGIFSSKGSQVAFPLESGNGGNTAIFDGKGWGLLAGETYQAYYPYNYSNRNSERIEFDNTTQIRYSMDNPTSGLSKTDFMYSERTTPTGNTLTFSLKRLGSIVRVDVDLSALGQNDISPSGLVIEEAELIAKNYALPSHIVFNGISGNSIGWESTGKSIKLKILNPSAFEGDVASFYFMVYDYIRTESETYTLTIKAADGFKYVVPLGDVENSFVAGKAYRLTGIAKNASNYITNANLVAAIKASDNSITTNSDGWIDVSANQSKLEAIKSINLSYKRDPHVCDEIGALKGLETLYCIYNSIEHLDLSNLTELIVLNVSNNNLTELDLSSNKKLENLTCLINRLTYLDLSSNTVLWSLNCASNQLSHLDIHSPLSNLICSDNNIQSITTNQQQNSLYELICDDNQIYELNSFIQGAESLGTLDCSNNKLTDLELRSLTALKILDCSDNQLSDLNIYSTKISSLKCQNNNLRYINVNGQVKGTRLLTQLSTLHAYGNMLDALYIDGLRSLDITGEGFQVGYQRDIHPWVIIDSQQYAQLANLYEPQGINNGIVWKYDTIDYITNPNLVAAIISKNPFITKNTDGYIPVEANKTKLEGITSIDVSDKNDPNCCDEISVLTGLTSLDCYNNNISSLIINKLTQLERLSCNNNNLSSLDITRNTKLIELSCSLNKLTYLNLTYNTQLINLFCGNNKISSLSMPSSKTTLKQLFCDNNELTQLNVSGCTGLTNLVCPYNHMNYLDIRTCTNLPLTNVFCGGQTSTTGASLQLSLHYKYKSGQGSFNSSDPDNGNVVLILDDTSN